ncbi:hypothetical protein [Rhodopila sp.]|uniref:hypothetical protein n=1 Tax=Rhodopila sp. TaxID=2480087 RepID=UPI003D0BEFC7
MLMVAVSTEIAQTTWSILFAYAGARSWVPVRVHRDDVAAPRSEAQSLLPPCVTTGRDTRTSSSCVSIVGHVTAILL